MEAFLREKEEEALRTEREMAAALRRRAAKRRSEHQALKAQIAEQREVVRLARLAASSNPSHQASLFFKGDFRRMGAADRAAALELGDDLPAQRARAAAAAARRRRRERAAWAARRAAAAAAGSAAAAVACARAVARLRNLHGTGDAQRQHQLEQMKRLVYGLPCVLDDPAHAPASLFAHHRRPPLPEVILAEAERAAHDRSSVDTHPCRTRLRPSPRRREAAAALAPGGPGHFGLAESRTRRAIVDDTVRQLEREEADKRGVRCVMEKLEDLDVTLLVGLEEVEAARQQQDEEGGGGERLEGGRRR